MDKKTTMAPPTKFKLDIIPKGCETKPANPKI